MNFTSLKTLLIITLIATTVAFGKRPKKEKPPKEPRPALTQEQKQVILTNVAQVMGGICTIAQDPRNPHNIGTSIGTMIQALINIIVEKFAHRTRNMNDEHALQAYLNELSEDISKEITEIIITKSLLIKQKAHDN
jgi:hypothetical protein